MDTGNSYIDNYNRIFNEAMAQSRALGCGVKVGRLFSVNVADGRAWYEIVKIGKRTVKVKWRKDLSLDGYSDFMLGEGGSVNRSKIESILNWEDAISRMVIKH